MSDADSLTLPALLPATVVATTPGPTRAEFDAVLSRVSQLETGVVALLRVGAAKKKSPKK